MSVQRKLSQGQLPAAELIEGIFLGIGGALLLTPGFVTDFFGFLCLIPTTRAMMSRFLWAKAIARGATEMMGGVEKSEFFQEKSDVYQRNDALEGEFKREK